MRGKFFLVVLKYRDCRFPGLLFVGPVLKDSANDQDFPDGQGQCSLYMDCAGSEELAAALHPT